jgi:hypothetical protein
MTLAINQRLDQFDALVDFAGSPANFVDQKILLVNDGSQRSAFNNQRNAIKQAVSVMIFVGA